LVLLRFEDGCLKDACFEDAYSSSILSAGASDGCFIDLENDFCLLERTELAMLSLFLGVGSFLILS